MISVSIGILLLVNSVFGANIERQDGLGNAQETQGRASAYSTEENDGDFIARVVGGQVTSFNKNKFSLAVLNSKGELVGGAALVNKNWALTAAWNVYNDKQVTLRTGSSNGTSGGTIIKVTKVIPHPAYKGTWENDLAMLKISPQQRNILKIARNLPKQNARVVIVGWGSANGKNNTNGQLRTGNTIFIDSKSCSKHYSAAEHFTSTSFCTQNTKEFGPCFFDFGSPLLNKKQMIGLFSGSYSCTNPKYPAVYTDVTHFKSWIDNIKKQ